MSNSKKIPNKIKNTKLYKNLLNNNENNINLNKLYIPNHALYFNQNFYQNINNPNLSLNEKAKSLIKLIKTYRYWANNNSNSLYTNEIFHFLFNHKDLLKQIIDSDESYFLKYNIKFYKEYRKSLKLDINSSTGIFIEDIVSINVYKKARFQKYLNNREYYENNLYNKNNYKKDKLFNFIDDIANYPLLQIIEVILNVPENNYYDVFAAYGFLNILTFLYSQKNHIKPSKKYSCFYASKFGHLKCLQFLREIVKASWDSSICYAAARWKHFDCLEYAHKNKCSLGTLTCLYAAIGGNISCLKYAHENGCPWTVWTCARASEKGNLICLIYAHENGCDWDEKTCELASLNGYLDCLEYAHENTCPWNKATCEAAAKGGHIECLIYAHKNGCEWDEKTCEEAAKNGNLECLIYAYENGCPWDENTCSESSRNGYLECLIYAHNNKCPWNDNTCINAAEKGHLDCLAYAHKNGCPWDHVTCTMAASGGNIDCLEYAHKNGCPWTVNTCNEAAKNKRFDCLEFAICNGCPFYFTEYTEDVQNFIRNLKCLINSQWNEKTCLKPKEYKFINYNNNVDHRFENFLRKSSYKLY